MPPPLRVGRYEIVAKLASGGMAEVFLARLRGLSGFERPVVVKRILPHLAELVAFRTMFLEEARVVARIFHPNVVQVHELGNDDEQLFLVMEYLEGESAASLLRRSCAQHERLPPALAAFIVAEVCAGLEAAHELKTDSGASLGLVHRDVSPQNVFLTYRGEVKLLDFGIAKTGDSVARTETGTIKGKFEYMSPEQCLGEDLDRRADIFSAGVVLYELVMGKRLFARENQLLTMQAICNERLVAPSELDATVPLSLSRVCLRALASRREDRYQTAAELRRALLGVVRELTTDEPAEMLASLMTRLFADRRTAKQEALRNVEVSGVVARIPEGEADVDVAVPTVAGGTVAGKAEAKRGGTSATASVEIKAAAAEASRPPRQRIIVALATAVVISGLAWLTVRRTPGESPLPNAGAPTVAAPSPLVDAAKARVKIEIDSVPSGAHVRLGGDDRGETPLTLDLDRGDVPLSLELSRNGATLSRTLVPDVDQRVVLPLPATPDARVRPTATPPTAPRFPGSSTGGSHASPATSETSETAATPSAPASASAKPRGFRRFE